MTVHELAPGMTYCTQCLDGEVWLTCGRCKGDGCPKCDGGGEVLSPTPCPLCGGGKGEVTRALASLADADRYVAHQEPGWDGSCRTKPYTIYSKAAYYRRREELGSGRVVGLRAIVTDGGDHRVVLLDPQGTIVVTFYGFCWGYGGEGPNGLADVLADLLPSRFPTQEHALHYVASRPMESSWELEFAAEAHSR